MDTAQHDHAPTSHGGTPGSTGSAIHTVGTLYQGSRLDRCQLTVLHRGLDETGLVFRGADRFGSSSAVMVISMDEDCSTRLSRLVTSTRVDTNLVS